MSEGADQMERDKLDELGPMMNEIGVEATEIVGGSPDGLYLFAEFDDGVIDAAVFKDEGNAVRYFDPTNLLFDLLGEAWEIESPDSNRRWAVMHYEVRGTAFHVELTYPEELDLNEDMTDRRRAALKKRYGDKPIIYPPVPEHFMELK